MDGTQNWSHPFSDGFLFNEMKTNNNIVISIILLVIIIPIMSWEGIAIIESINKSPSPTEKGFFVKEQNHETQQI